MLYCHEAVAIIPIGGPNKQVSEGVCRSGFCGCWNSCEHCYFIKYLALNSVILQLSLNMVLLKAENFSPTKRMIVQRFIPFPATCMILGS